MHHFEGGHELCGGIETILEIFDDSLLHRLPVLGGIERGNVDALDLLSLFQESEAGKPLLLALAEKASELDDHVLALAHHEDIEEVGDRLRIDGGGSSSDDEGIALVTILGIERNARAIHHVEDAGIEHLVLHGESEDIEIFQGALGLETHQRHTVLAKQGAKIGRGRETTLADRPFLAVQHVVEKFQSEIGHPHFVEVGHTDTETDVALFPHIGGIVLSAAVTSRFLYFQ